jgi:hypothetical protein
MPGKPRGPGGARPGAGRPRDPNARRRKVTIKLTDEELARYQGAAADEELSLSDWWREAAELAFARGSTR